MTEALDRTFNSFLVGDIDYPSIGAVIRDINCAYTDGYGQVRLLLTSEGGELFCGLALYDYIKTSPIPVDILAVDQCKSAAVIVLQAARRRLAYTRTGFMLHPIYSTYHHMDDDEMKMLTVEARSAEHRGNDIIIKRTGIDQQEFYSSIKPRLNLSASKAKKFGRHGLIDAITNKIW